LADRTFFDDEDFQDGLLSILSKDITSLRQVGSLLEPSDFEPIQGMRSSRSRWIAATVILNHYQKYQESVGSLLRSECLAYVRSTGLDGSAVRDVDEYVKKLRKRKLKGVEAIIDRVVDFKKQKKKEQAIDQMIELHGAGELSDEKMFELCQESIRLITGEVEQKDFFKKGAEQDRIAKRKRKKESFKIPYFCIPPLDKLIDGIGPGGLGIIIAPAKRGKSLMLLWLARAFAIQRLSTLFITLEDPKEEVENRLDSLVSGIKVKSLTKYESLFKKRYNRFIRMVRKKLLIVDGTEGGMTLERIEELYLRERDKGNIIDALIIDYDDEIQPSIKRRDRREEFSDIYRGLRRLASKYNLIVWTAAQTQRDTEDMKMLGGSKIADDIGKARKCTLALGLGKGDWGDDSIYLYVALHKFDEGGRGANIMPDRKRMMIYDEEATKELQATMNQTSDLDDLDSMDDFDAL